MTGAKRTSRVGNNAVGTEVLTALLYLDEGSRPLMGSNIALHIIVDDKLLEFMSFPDVAYL